ncbi:MarC family protein [Roseibium sp.]|uniref:MarC family protein n=1 Tax=Roseibium sp. TaxID=1936156 RepID=UPI003A980209
MDQAFFLKMFAALFAIMNPIANLPVFLSLTGERTAGEQRAVAITVTIALVLGCVIVALSGNAILNIFGISLDSFRLAGGFLILLIALNLLSGEQSKTHHGTDKEKAHHAGQDNPGIYPLTVPILLGPGTISTLIIFRGQAETLAKEVAYVVAAGASVTLLAITFLLAPQLASLFGQTATSVMSRLMGMILAAIAMEMMVTSLKALLPGLA